MKKSLVVLATCMFFFCYFGFAYGWSAIAVNQTDPNGFYGTTVNAPSQSVAESRALMACRGDCTIVYIGAEIGWWGIYISKPLFSGVNKPAWDETNVVFGTCVGKKSQNAAMGCAANSCISLGGKLCGNSGPNGYETFGDGQKKEEKSKKITKENKGAAEMMKRIAAEERKEKEMLKRMEADERKEAAILEKMIQEEKNEKDLADQMAVEELVEKAHDCLSKKDFNCSKKHLDDALPLARTDTAKYMLNTAITLNNEQVRLYEEQQRIAAEIRRIKEEEAAQQQAYYNELERMERRAQQDEERAQRREDAAARKSRDNDNNYGTGTVIKMPTQADFDAYQRQQSLYQQQPKATPYRPTGGRGGYKAW